VAFDPSGRDPYTDAADGRVVFWDSERWAPFAMTSPRWTQELCGGPKALPLEYLPTEYICGSPLGLRFDKRNRDLYITDAYFGLLKGPPRWSRHNKELSRNVRLFRFALPSSDHVLVLPIGTRPLDIVGAASSSSRGTRQPCCGPRPRWRDQEAGAARETGKRAATARSIY
jgi:hypothetical protein